MVVTLCGGTPALIWPDGVGLRSTNHVRPCDSVDSSQIQEVRVAFFAIRGNLKKFLGDRRVDKTQRFHQYPGVFVLQIAHEWVVFTSMIQVGLSWANRSDAAVRLRYKVP